MITPIQYPDRIISDSPPINYKCTNCNRYCKVTIYPGTGNFVESHCCKTWSHYDKVHNMKQFYWPGQSMYIIVSGCLL